VLVRLMPLCVMVLLLLLLLVWLPV